MTIPAPQFREGQWLRAADLRAGQEYHLAMRRRHDLGPHTGGVVAGLDLAEVQGGIVVQPGTAVDGLGRTLVLLQPAPLRLPDRAGPGSLPRVEVWLRYRRDAATPAGPGRRPCGPGRNSRWVEGVSVDLRLGDGPPPAQPDPIGQPDPHCDDSSLPAPVYLGAVVRWAAGDRIDRAGRWYAGLVGERVSDPAGRARVQLGPERPGDRRRFTVAVEAADGGCPDRLVVAGAADLALKGPAVVRGDQRDPAPPADKLRLDGARGQADRPVPPSGLRLGPVPPPEAATPWRLYRARQQPQGREGHELRFELRHPGDEGDPATFRMVVGDGVDVGLMVRADCTVVVGHLTVQGRVVEGPIAVDPGDERFTGTLASEYLKGVAAAAGTAGAASRLDLGLTLPVPATNGSTCVVTMTNAGSIPVTDITVDAVISPIGGPNTSVRRVVLDTKRRLEPGQRIQYQNPTLQGSPGNTFQVTVIALGVGPAANPVYGQVFQQVTIQPPQPTPPS